MSRTADKPDYAAGAVILIDKPTGWTSFDVVAKLRNGLKVKKIGHAGTLDPLATGLLILCTGAYTKRIQEIQDADKTYIAEITFGATTDTYDAEGSLTPGQDPAGLTEEKVKEALQAFVGPILQMPPAFSALKVKGKRAYELARAGQTPELKARAIHIHSLELSHWAGPVAVVQVQCSKGTYIRSLAHDLGQALGTGAYLSGLRRTAIGTYSVAQALSPEAYLARFGAQARTDL
ncbi:MAG: tRNA pseudouridine(55) synthase TruB [Bacteroidetes bacterium]|jgi:tRNA pseudouridine55 synthase|nr:tRNA pseudouridine(55) synthase TruB [Bacteroidota bacterium]